MEVLLWLAGGFVGIYLAYHIPRFIIFAHLHNSGASEEKIKRIMDSLP